MSLNYIIMSVFLLVNVSHGMVPRAQLDNTYVDYIHPLPTEAEKPTEDPGQSNQDPGYSNQDPGYSNQDPGYANQDPGYANQDQGNLDQDSGHATLDPGHVNQDAGHTSHQIPAPDVYEESAHIPADHMYHRPGDNMDCKNPAQDGSPYFEDPLDCNCYHVCSKRNSPIRMCCPSGLWWDQTSYRCLFGRDFGLRKQAQCLQMARRKVIAQARSSFHKQLMDTVDAATDSDGETVEKAGSDNDASSTEKMLDLSLDRYYANVPEEYIFGHCSVQPNPVLAEQKDQVWGSIDLRQSLKGGATELRVNLTGFSVVDNNRFHGFHVHEFGDLSEGCQSAGGHYDPFGVVHGGPRDSPRFRHFGDLGNIEEDSAGVVEKSLKDYLASLLGPFSVLGRAIVIHESQDDLGRGSTEDSLMTGSAGSRIACCTIGLSNGSRWP